MHSTSGKGLADLLVFLVLLGMYLSPAIIAFIRGHKSRWGIAVLNLFFGWSVLGWFISLIWSLSNNGINNNVINITNTIGSSATPISSSTKLTCDTSLDDELNNHKPLE